MAVVILLPAPVPADTLDRALRNCQVQTLPPQYVHIYNAFSLLKRLQPDMEICGEDFN